MREENINNLITKYKLGTSSLKEEQFLFNNADDKEPVIKKLSAFAKKNKKIVPDDLNNRLWESFEKRRIRKNRFRIKLVAVAASILLIITIYISTISQHKMSYSEKEALLSQAQKMFTDPLPIHNVIIESDLVIVYMKTE